MNSKHIAIIGAGNSGICAFNACQEQGLRATVFEMTDDICGQWIYREGSIEGCTSIYKSLIVNSSKEMTAFSNFPPPKEFPNIMVHSKMGEYIRMYANRIGFTKAVKLRHQVIKCEPNNDHDHSGKWKLTVKDCQNATEITSVFDGVMVCTGQFQKKCQPQFDGLDKFEGIVMHSHEFKSSIEFENKNVVVVGLGVSGTDIAAALSSTSNQVYLSTRSGAWLSSKISLWGLPFDYLLLRRVFYMLPTKMRTFIAETYSSIICGTKFYGIEPKHRFLDQVPLTAESLPLKLLMGEIVIKGDIKLITECGVIFKGENEVTMCDAIIFATGYHRSFPFLDESVFIPYEIDPTDDFNYYEYQFLPQLKYPETLCFIASLGIVLCPTLPVAELQSRWFSLLMADKIKNLDRKEMYGKMRQVKNKWTQKYGHQAKLVNFNCLEYMDRLAKKIGSKPNLVKYLFTDIKLWIHLIFGPFLSYQYRLSGPNKWSGAREAILTAYQRISYPLKNQIIR